jgi:hypothetical protein
LFSNNAGVFSIQQVEDAPAGFRFSSKVTTTTADASVTGADRANFAQIVENANWQRFGWGTSSPKTVTVSFWVKSSLTGTFFFATNVTGAGANYYSTYTINTANTWEYKTLTIPGPPASALWAANNTDVYFGLVSGPDRQTSTLNAWNTDSFNAQGTSTTVNLIATLNATWQITGWQIEAGNVATPFTRAAGSISGELALCQRYYYRQTSGSAYGWMAYGGCQNTVNGQAGLVLPVTMRTVPSGSLEYANVRITDSSYAGTLVSLALNAGESTPNLADIYVTATGITGGRPLYVGANNNAAAYIAVTAEL